MVERLALWLRPMECKILVILLLVVLFLSLSTNSFLTLQNLFDIINNQSVNIVFAVGLVVVLVFGGIDISFAVGASVVQYVVVTVLLQLGYSDWLIGLGLAALVGLCLGLVNAALIHGFRIVSIIVTIATFNVFFGLLMFVSGGRSIYSLPGWMAGRVPLLRLETPDGVATLYLPVLLMSLVVTASWWLLHVSGWGRQITGYGSNAEAARRSGVKVWLLHGLAYGWLGICAGIAGLMQANIAREVVPNALNGRELDILAAVVLGGATLGGGRGTVAGAVLGVLLLAVVNNGLNLLGVTPYAYKAIVGTIILLAISTTMLFSKRRSSLIASGEQGASS